MIIDETVSDAPAVDVTSADSTSPAVDAKSATTDWGTSFNIEHSALVEEQGWKSTDDILNSFKLMQETLGEDKAGRGLFLPKDEDDAEGFETIYKALGRPDDPEEYGFMVDGVDENSADFNKTISEAMLTAGLSKSQAGKLGEAWQAYAGRLQAAQNEAFNAELETVKGFKPETVEAARRGYRFLAADLPSDEFKNVAAALETHLGPVRITEMMAKLGKAMNEDKTIAGLASGGLSPQSAESKIQKMKDDPIFMKRYLNGDIAAYAEMEELHKKVASI